MDNHDPEKTASQYQQREHENHELRQREHRGQHGTIPGSDGAGMSVGRYLATRTATLKPPLTPLPNPFKALALLNKQQWLFFLVAFAGWTWDAFDFFTVSLTIPNLAETFGKKNSDISWGITCALMTRSVGAAIFGIWADRYGRKWPFCVNLLLFSIFELATGFCNTYEAFLAVRTLYGVCMGGLFGMAAATALEDCPPAARGIISGMLQQGYAFGYLLATAFARALVDTTPHAWRPLYWFGACPPVLIIAFRLCLPETNTFLARQRMRESGNSVGKTFVSEGKVALRKHWRMLIYLVLLMAGFNFMSHGSQDLYPTMLTNQYQFSQDALTVTQVVANAGAMTGGTIVGYLSQSLGRRFSIIYSSIIGGALLYAYTFVSDSKIIAAAFFEQFCVQGAWGVIPIHLMELSPGGFRTFVVGTSYQLGNLVSSASSTIESTIGERFPLEPIVEADGTVVNRYNYARVICIFMGAVFAYVLVLAFLGPERLAADLDVDADEDVDELRQAGVVGGSEDKALRDDASGGSRSGSSGSKTYVGREENMDIETGKHAPGLREHVQHVEKI